MIQIFQCPSKFSHKTIFNVMNILGTLDVELSRMLKGNLER